MIIKVWNFFIRHYLYPPKVLPLIDTYSSPGVIDNFNLRDCLMHFSRRSVVLDQFGLASEKFVRRTQRSSITTSGTKSSPSRSPAINRKIFENFPRYALLPQLTIPTVVFNTIPRRLRAGFLSKTIFMLSRYCNPQPRAGSSSAG